MEYKKSIDFIKDTLKEIEGNYPKANLEDYTDEFDDTPELMCLINSLICQEDCLCDRCVYNFVMSEYSNEWVKVYDVNLCRRDSTIGLK